jgi:chorismate mutase
MQKKLLKIRKKINSIDSKLIALLQERSFIIPKVKKIKENFPYKIAFKREFDMAKKFQSTYFGLYNVGYMQKIWRELISATLYIECQLFIDIYKNSSNYADLWEITKDHFSGISNLKLSGNLEESFNKLINKEVEAVIVPTPQDSDIDWWNKMQEEKYKNIRISLKLPMLKQIKTLNNMEGFCLSLNTKDIFNNKFYLVKTTVMPSDVKILWQKDGNYFIESTLSLHEVIEQNNIKAEDIKFLGSSSDDIL